MAKKMKKTLSMILVLCMMASMFSMPALAAETVVTDTYKDGNGNNVVVTTTTTTTSEKNEQGATVDTTIVFTETEVTTDAGEFVSYKWTEDGVEKTSETKAPTGEVDVPLTEGEKAEVPGNVEVGEGETVEDQGKITVETTDIEVKENFSEIDTDMTHVSADVTPNETNDLTYTGGDDTAPEEYLPGYEGEPVIPENPDNYDYIYVGSGNTSKFFPAIVYETPMSDKDKVAMYGENAYIKKNSITYYYVGWLKEEDRNNLAKDELGNYITDEQGFILDKEGNRVLKEERTEKGPNGETTYLHRFDNYNSNLKAEGWFEDGDWVADMNGDEGYYGVWSGPQQFILVGADGKVVTTYCADNTTPTQDSYGYNVENLEDATYYSDEEAARIRAIANAGYWGTTSGFGSLEEMKKNLMDTNQFSEEELACLTDGLALTATQMAIWSNSNKMSGVKFFNSHYSNWGPGNVPADKTEEVELMFKIYDYLINLEGTEVEQNTAETIINEDNFIKNLCVSVIEKVTGHANNNDEDKNNDAYVTNVTFALVVEPVEGNEDELVVKVVTGGQTYIGRIAGEAQEGEVQLVADENGNYTFKGITMVEGEQNFNISMTGVQNLKEGVYLYTSEVRDGVSSQTLVGVSHGQRDVNVSMDVKFNLNVDDAVVSKERTWHDEGDPGVNVPPAVFVVHRPLENIPEEEVPLADAPQTGDEAIVFAAMTLLAGISLMAMHVSEKKRKEEV